jgi:hypothetical protein
MSKSASKKARGSKQKTPKRGSTGSASGAYTDALLRNTAALKAHTRALADHTSILRLAGMQQCVLSHLGKTQADLDTEFGKLFGPGIVQPIDLIIEECGQDCYPLTPKQVYEKIGDRSVNTLRQFIACIGR